MTFHLRNAICMFGMVTGLALVGAANHVRAAELASCAVEYQDINEAGEDQSLCERFIITADRRAPATERLARLAKVDERLAPANLMARVREVEPVYVSLGTIK